MSTQQAEEQFRALISGTGADEKDEKKEGAEADDDDEEED